MKKPKHTSRISKKVGLRTILGILVGLGLIALTFGIITCIVLYKMEEKEGEKKFPAEERIVKLLSEKPVTSRFSPVLLYRTKDTQVSYFIGTGSVFTGSEGKQIVTSEHVLQKEFGKELIAWRTLRPLDSMVTGGISAILHRGDEIIPGAAITPDVVILQTGAPTLVDFYSEKPMGARDETQDIAPVLEMKMLTSLITGKKVRMIGTAKAPQKNAATHILIEYDSFEGESGTGFVDEHDALYILKGHVELDPVTLKRLGNPTAVAMVLSPLHLNK